MIQQQKYSCIYCCKNYIKKTNYNNHIIVCELLHKNFKSTILDDEPIPSQKKMYKIILELSKKINIMDEKINELNKWVIKKKKKINLIEWLNVNIIPEFEYNYLIDRFIILEDDINYLFDNSFIDVFYKIFSRNILNFNIKFPIFAFIQKSNIIYIYENKDVGWVEFNKDKFNLFLNNIYYKFVKIFTEWKKDNKLKINNDEKLQMLCDKTSFKIYSIDLKKDIILAKIISFVYNLIKKDIEGLIEYEFDYI
jgi:hypothetical protein